MIEMLCPECGDSWPTRNADKPDECPECGYFGMPKKNVVTNYQLKKFTDLIVTMSERLKEEDAKNKP